MKPFTDDVLESLPKLKRFARRLAGNASLGDDLVQETVLRALLHADQFRPGTNLSAWLSTILRNCYFNQMRSGRRIVSLESEATVPTPTINSPQESHVYMSDVTCRFADLPAAQREALVLVGANGHSYEAAAKIAGCAVGTMKSRVSRARTELKNSLDRGHTQVLSQSMHQRDLDHLDRAA